MYSIKELSGLFQEGKVRPSELIEDVFARVKENAEEENIFITLTEEIALHQAERVEKELKEGRPGSMLRGIPFTLKDVFETKGILTTGGSKVLEGNIPSEDAEVVKRLYSTGALLLGKVNLHEFAYGATGRNPHYGTVRNPYNKAKLAGGSSSGSAGAVAAGYGCFSLGTDTGGSSRVPAALSGLAGFKPTYGLISCKGVIPLSWTLDHVGVLACSAEDIRIVLEETGYIEKAEQNASNGCTDIASLKGLRIGIPTSFFYENLEPDVATLMEKVKERFIQAGADLIDVELPDLEDSRTASLVIQLPEILSYHSKWLEENSGKYAEDMLAGMAAGQFILAEQYVKAKRIKNYYKNEIGKLFDTVDMLLLPAAPCTAPDVEEDFVDIGGEKVPAGNAVTRFLSLFNMTGDPSLVAPAGFSKDGLPIGYQLVGRSGDDIRILRTAEIYDEAYDLLHI